MATFVLMHGGGMGGWTWKYVRGLLREAGHDVFTPSYAGFAEHEHLIGREIDHGVHVKDIANLLRYEDLTDVTLVAHSYSGSVVPGVVDAEPGRVRRSVYLDALVPHSGERINSMMGFTTEEQASGLDAMLASGEGPAGSGVHLMQRELAKAHPPRLPPDRAEWLLSNLSDMPLRCVVSPIAVGAEHLKVPVDYVAADDMIMAPMHARAAHLGWTLHKHAGDHMFMVGDPEGTVDLILGSDRA